MSIQWLTNAGNLEEPVEMDGSQREQFADDGATASVILKCAWSDRHRVMSNILTHGPRWPYTPTAPIYAVNASIVPFPGGVGTQLGQGYSYAEAQIAVNFATREKTEEDDPVIYSESLEPTAEFLTLPHTDFRWGSASGTAIRQEEAPGRLEVGFDYVVTKYNLSSIPSGVLTLPGKSNNATVVSPSLGLSFATETLMFNPPTISRSVSLEGENKYTMQTRLTFKAQGWNVFWRPQSQAYEAMYHKDGSGAYKNFAPASFADVLP